MEHRWKLKFLFLSLKFYWNPMNRFGAYSRHFQRERQAYKNSIIGQWGLLIIICDYAFILFIQIAIFAQILAFVLRSQTEYYIWVYRQGIDVVDCKDMYIYILKRVLILMPIPRIFPYLDFPAAYIDLIPNKMCFLYVI